MSEEQTKQPENPQEEAKSPDTDEPDQSKLGIKELSPTCLGKLGHCTRKMKNEINNDIRFGGGDADSVKAQLEEFQILKTFNKSHESVQMLLI